MSFVYVVFVFAIFGAFAFYAIKQQKKINAEVQAFATQKGLAYQAKVPARAVVPEVDIFDGGLQARDLLSESSGAMTFFFIVTRQEGRSSITGSFLAHKNPVASQVSFTLIPSSSNIEFFRHSDLSPLKFESDDLNRVYRLWVKPGDEVNTLELLGPDVMLWLVRESPNSVIVGRSGSLYVFAPNFVRIPHDNSTAGYEAQYNIVTAIADYLVSHSSGQTPPPTTTPAPPVSPPPAIS